MKNIYVDTNIVLDLLLGREEFLDDAKKVFSLADAGLINLYLSSLTIVNASYVLSKKLGPIDAKKRLANLKVLTTVLPLNDKILELSIASDFKDFEDGVQYFTAVEHSMDLILTRNKKDFKDSKLAVMTSKEYIQSL